MAHPSNTPSLDVEFLRRWSPARWMAAGMIFYAVAVITSPLEYDFSVVTWPALLYAVVSMAAFFIGCYFGNVINGQNGPIKPLPFQGPVDRYINLAIFIAAIGIASRVYDRFVLRGFAVMETFGETRESLEGQVSAFGYVGGLSFSFGLIALALFWITRSESRRPVAYVIAALLAAYPMAEGLVAAGRSATLHTAVIVFILARSTNALSWLIRSRVALLAVGLALLALFQLLFEIRTLEGGGYEESISEVYRLTGMAQYAQPPAWLTNEIVATEGQGFFVFILKNWAHVEQHLTHSWVVYFANFNNFDGQEFGWGSIHFSLPARVLAAIFNQQITYSAFLHGMDEGMYSTFLSIIFYDFGAIGPLIVGLFGLVQTLVQAKAIRTPERWLPLYALLCLGNVMAFVENPLTSGLGAFAIWGMLLYVFLHFVISVISKEADPVVEPPTTGPPAAGAPTSST